MLGIRDLFINGIGGFRRNILYGPKIPDGLAFIPNRDIGEKAVSQKI
jgi:hypothetical protein